MSSNDIEKYFKYRDDPQLFIEEVFNAKLFKWQKELCDKIKKEFLSKDDKNITFKTAIAGANNTGKSWFGRMLLLWHFCSHQNSRNYILTNSEKQTKRIGFGKLQNDISNLYKPENVICGESIYFKTKIGGTNGIWDIGYFGITSKQSSITGLHDPYMFFFFDEAINFNDEIWTALETMCASGRVIVYASANPTSIDNGFYQIFSNSKDNIDTSWYTRNISYYDLPLDQYNQNFASTMIAKYGISSVKVRSAIFGEFVDETSAKRFPKKLIIEAMQRENPYPTGEIVMGIDVSEDTKFGASSAICLRQGKTIISLNQYKEEYNTFLESALQEITDKLPDVVAVDANGIGFGLYNSIRKIIDENYGMRLTIKKGRGIRVIKVKGHQKSHARGMFGSRRDELFWIASNWLLSGDAVMPYDPDLIIAMSAIEFDSLGKAITVISKKDLKKKLGEIGPMVMDKLDAFIYSFAEYEYNELNLEDNYYGRNKKNYTI